MIKYYRQFKWAISVLSRDNRRYESKIAQLWGKSCHWKKPNNRRRNKLKASRMGEEHMALPKYWKRILLSGGNHDASRPLENIE